VRQRGRRTMVDTALVESRSIPYHKILGPFKRDMTRGSETYGKVVHGEWSTPEFKFLADVDWLWTEKIDGTNVRIHWDGVSLKFDGRTDRAQLPERLASYLDATFTDALFEEKFGSRPVTLYGEGYGGKIQKGGKYRPDESFALFDVRVNEWWLQPESVQEISESLGIDAAPVMFTGSVLMAIEAVGRGLLSKMSKVAWTAAEGVVGVPAVSLMARNGHRIVMKVKAEDFGGD
jgi:hypothetical protein